MPFPDRKFLLRPHGFLAVGGLIVVGLLIVYLMFSPACTGPAAEQPCDYASIAQPQFEDPDRSLEVVDLGSSVQVQYASPNDRPLDDAIGVVIDKSSCQVCQISSWRQHGHRIRLAVGGAVALA